jgi:HK97 family phage portal protein
MHLELTGNEYWSMEGLDSGGRPSELYIQSPELVQILPSRQTGVAGYKVTRNGRSVTYQPEEMLHHSYGNPLSDLYGMGVIEAAEMRADSARAMAVFERDFWTRGAKFTGVLTTLRKLSDGDFKSLVTRFQNFMRRGHTTLILEDGLDYKSVSDGPARLGLLPLSKMSRDEILAMFGVPPTKVGILENANYKAQASDEFFWTETVAPKLTRMEQSLQRLVDLFHPDEGLRIAFDRLNFSDDLAMANVSVSLANSHSRTLNEIRAYQNQDPIDGGDVILIPAGLVPFDPNATMPNLVGQTLPVKGRVGARLPATSHVITKHRDALVARADRVHTPRLKSFFAAQEARVLRRLPGYQKRKHELDIDRIFLSDEERSELSALLQDVWGDAMKAGYDTANQVGVSVSFDLENPRIQAFRGTLASRVDGINATTRDALDTQILEGLRRGYSMQQIADGVEEEGYAGVKGVFSTASGSRAAAISRTESMDVWNGAAMLAYNESGVVSQVEALDGTDDPECAARNGQRFSLDEAAGIRDHPNGVLCWAPVVESGT